MGSVVVIGSGYAGVRAAKAAKRHGALVTLLDTDGRHHFGPRLAGVAAGAADEEDGAAAVESLAGVPVEVGTVRSVDRQAKTVTLTSGEQHHWDALVVTTGARPSRPPIDGLERFALDLRDNDDARRIHRALVGTDHVVVIGGGASGVQLAGEVAAAIEGIRVDLVERAPRLLPEMSSLVGRRAAKILGDRGVHVHVATEVAAVTATGVDLVGGVHLPGAVVWAGGFEPVGHHLLSDAPLKNGRIDVQHTLAVHGWPDVFVAGDAAAHVDLLGRQVGMSAQIAVQAGKAAGRNAALVASGRDAIPALLLDLGRVVSMGGGRGVAQLGPVPLGLFGSDRLVPLLHEAIDLRHLLETGGISAILRHARGQAAKHADGAPERPALRLVHSAGS